MSLGETFWWLRPQYKSLYCMTHHCFFPELNCEKADQGENIMQ